MAKSKKKEEEKKEEKKKELSPSVIALRKEIKVLMVFVAGSIILLSYANAAGVIGKFLSEVLFGMLGVIAYIVPFFVMGAYIFILANPGNVRLRNKLICFSFLILFFAAFMQLFHYGYDSKFQFMKFFSNSAAQRNGGGLLGGLVANMLAYLLGKWGAYIILLALFAVACMYLTEKFLFAHLGKKGKIAYEKVKEKAVRVAEERAIARESEELEELEDWEQEEPRKAKFFSFKKDKSEKNKEETKESPELIEIVADENKEATPETVESQEEKTDNLEFLTIQRGNEESVQEEPEQEKNAQDMEEILAKEVEEAMKEDIPIYQQEINQKFAENPDEEIQEKAQEEAPLEFSCTIESKEPKEGLVLDAVEQEGGPLPEDIVLQTESNGQYVMDPKLPDTESQTEGDSKEEAIEVTEVLLQKEYQFPTVDLLTKPEKNEKGMSDEELKEKARKLQETLESFGVRARVVNVSCGPAVTRFELQPEQGVKVSKITALSDDIKLNMAAEEIRIEAPIPGKAAVGIEVPNQKTTMVHLRDLVENKKFKKHASNIAFAVGKDIGGQVIVTDIAKMPHLLIAGATGFR